MARQQVSQQPVSKVGIKFVSEAPPPLQERRNDKFWAAVAEELRANSGSWALVKEYTSKGGAAGRASTINGGKSQVFPSTEFEARYTMVQNENGEDVGSNLFLRHSPQTAE